MKSLAEAAAAVLEKHPTSGLLVIPITGYPMFNGTMVDSGARWLERISCCTNFAAQMAVLQTLAEKELRQEAFTQTETDFIRSLMNRRDRMYGGPTFDGWYPGLFYRDYALGNTNSTPDENGSNKWDALVTDIFTAPPDIVDGVGGVLHEATRNVDLLMIAVDNGDDKMVYAGPVMSHYEFIVPGPNLRRLTDEEWQSQAAPSRPEWTRGYLVPK